VDFIFSRTWALISWGLSSFPRTSTQASPFGEGTTLKLLRAMALFVSAASILRPMSRFTA
jgi:hypothetical protein